MKDEKSIGKGGRMGDLRWTGKSGSVKYRYSMFPIIETPPLLHRRDGKPN